MGPGVPSTILPLMYWYFSVLVIPPSLFELYIFIMIMCLLYPWTLDCSQPVLSPNVSVVSTTGTTKGDTVTLQCEDGLFPVIPVMITCNSAGVWSPNPAELVWYVWIVIRGVTRI